MPQTNIMQAPTGQGNIWTSWAELQLFGWAFVTWWAYSGNTTNAQTRTTIWAKVENIDYYCNNYYCFGEVMYLFQVWWTRINNNESHKEQKFFVSY